MIRRATVGGSALGIAVGWNVSNVGAIAGSVANDYGVSLATVGLFTTALFVVHAGLQIPAGHTVDRLGARRVGFGALAVIALANALALATAEPALAIVARALAGIGTALGFVAGSDYVRAKGGSAFAQGLYGGLALGAGGLALAVVPLVQNWLAWRAPYWSALAIAVGGVLVLAAGPPDTPRPARRTLAGDAPASSVLRDRALRRLCVMYMASFGLSVVLGNWVVTLLEEAGRVSEDVAGAAGSLILLTGVVSRPLGGWIARQRPAWIRPALALSFAAGAAGTLALTAARPLALAVVGALVLGLAAGIPFAVSFGAAARVRPDAPAAAVAMVNMAANLVIVCGTPLVGLTFSLPGHGRIGFVATTALWLTALAIVPRMRELEPRPAVV